MYGVMHRMLLSSVSTIRQEAGLQHRTAGHVMMKLRSEFKVRLIGRCTVHGQKLPIDLTTSASRAQKTERALGGDGKWIDDFRFKPSRKRG